MTDLFGEDVEDERLEVDVIGVDLSNAAVKGSTDRRLLGKASSKGTEDLGRLIEHVGEVVVDLG